ncbi:MAG: BlaI/MecI/CopY family transcriptional regulator [Lachnospiraceae bacterium]|nr:BlaI/MecI/CopY family transcriptional regulator [Lachnospiraceae bacterium]
MKLTDAEWSVLEVLWSGSYFSLKEITVALEPIQGWSKKTVLTYLTRMEAKGLVEINRSREKPYAAGISREICEREERKDFCNKVYKGATGDMIAAFLKESSISKKEIERLRKLLDEMEV